MDMEFFLDYYLAPYTGAFLKMIFLTLFYSLSHMMCINIHKGSPDQQRRRHYRGVRQRPWALRFKGKKAKLNFPERVQGKTASGYLSTRRDLPVVSESTTQTYRPLSQENRFNVQNYAEFLRRGDNIYGHMDMEFFLDYYLAPYTGAFLKMIFLTLFYSLSHMMCINIHKGSPDQQRRRHYRGVRQRPWALRFKGKKAKLNFPERVQGKTASGYLSTRRDLPVVSESTTQTYRPLSQENRFNVQNYAEFLRRGDNSNLNYGVSGFYYHGYGGNFVSQSSSNTTMIPSELPTQQHHHQQQEI
ncbi:Hypothetical predicted protein [Olea europaea subsp. europaea]|uniref:Uncharacterized protein n=1 Tax=Olea europaea subsp. europaea TaxID=158383 RepID=A0A8S0QY79_OLEEU|nr:Hypothetical predicted protein [Olea europaea subsp. europaea]